MARKNHYNLTNSGTGYKLTDTTSERIAIYCLKLENHKLFKLNCGLKLWSYYKT